MPSGASRPLVVAHRGASVRAPEHTLEAYVAALDEGADGLECDVRLTADGHLVCFHDRDIRRTTGQEGLVSTMRLADLDELDFSSEHNTWSDLDDEAPDRLPSAGRLLTLQRLLETVRDYERPVRLAIETKHPTRYAGLVERRLVELLGRFGWTGHESPVRVMSFSWVALNRVARLAPNLPLVYLVSRRSAWYRAEPLTGQHWIAGPGIELVRQHPEFIRKLRRKGVRVHCWVVNNPADADLCQDLGVEALITDRPRWLSRHLAARAER